MNSPARQHRQNSQALGLRTCLAACLAVAALAPALTAAAPRGTAKKKGGSPVVTVTIHPVALAVHEEVSIGDVSTIEGGDTALRSRIVHLDLADAPQPGKTAQLTRGLIQHRLQIAGIDASRYKLIGAEAVTLSARGYAVSEQELVQAARQFLLSRLPWKPDEVSIEATRPAKGTVQVSGGREDIRFEASLNAPKIALGSVRVDVAILSKGIKQTEVPIVLDVHLKKTIAVAARRVDRGQTLTGEDVVYERRTVDNVAGYLAESDPLVGQRVKRTIQPLQPITKSDLDSAEPDAAVVIRQRDAVKLVARAGNLVVTVSGEALQDGRTGQMIRVRNVDSKAVVTGRVVNRNEVQVLY